MFILYDLTFLIVAIIYLPIYLFRRKFHRGFLLRLGILPKNLELDSPIWIHAVSVGEVMAVRRLVEELRRIYPLKKLVISTVTPTGNKIARNIARPCDFVTYLPLDFSCIVKNVIKKIKPYLFIIAETELWPNLISSLFRNNIPIAVVNARISDSSFRGYLSIKFFIKPTLKKVNLFCVQSERDCKRLMRLGVSGEQIRITGNMKFDTTDFAERSYPSSLSSASRSDTSQRRYIRDTDFKIKLGLNSKERLLVAASTHPREEEIILNVYKKLLVDFTDLRLLIAPRHPERTEDIEKIIIKFIFNPIRVSQLASLPVSQFNRQTGKPANRQTIFILDTIGELISFYALADIVFMGGSLVKKGGHNILEPAAQGKPILFGPHMFNFRDIAELFLKEQAAILVHNQDELKAKISYLLEHSTVIDEMRKKSQGLILQNQGATQRNLALIKGLYARLPL